MCLWLLERGSNVSVDPTYSIVTSNSNLHCANKENLTRWRNYFWRKIIQRECVSGQRALFSIIKRQFFSCLTARNRINCSHENINILLLQCYVKISSPEKSRNNTYEIYDYFSLVFDIANQLLTRHSPSRHSVRFTNEWQSLYHSQSKVVCRNFSDYGCKNIDFSSWSLNATTTETSTGLKFFSGPTYNY